MSRTIDWPALLQAGLCELRLTPDAFWQLTPAELQVMLGHRTGAAPMGGARLADLAARYPDRGKDNG